MRLPMYLVDAFSAKPFSGNPAAVVLVDQKLTLDDAAQQLIAREMNQSETAFVELMSSDSAQRGFTEQADFRLRWFTPTTEVPLCGHATLASAAVLFQEQCNLSPALRFHTQSGVLTVSRASSSRTEVGLTAAAAAAAPGGPLSMCMTLPLAEPSAPLPPPFPPCTGDIQGGQMGVALNFEQLSDRAQALVRACVGDLQVSECAFATSSGLKYLVMRLAPGTTQAQLQGIQPDMQAMLASATADDLRAVIVTCQGEPGNAQGFDFLSRFFAPWMGIPEDPVTGSAHAVLAPFWAQRLGGKGRAPGGDALCARQCSARGGEISVRCIGDTVQVEGCAVVVLSGTLCH